MLVPFSDGDDGPELLFTRRAWHLRSHRGEVCFPGGRLEPGDPDLATTALRETHEEIDLPPDAVTVVGELDRLTTVSSPSFIVPFVGVIDRRQPLTPDANEVDGIIHISLQELADPSIYREEIWTRDANEMAIYFFELVGDTLWGATARMVHNLLELSHDAMSSPSRSLSRADARRIALGAQGFADKAPQGAVNVRHFRRALDRMSILQLDSVNVLVRSHFLPMFSRLGPYDRAKLDHWIWHSGENHEYLAHEASITSMDLHPMLRWRMQDGRWKAGRELEEGQPEYLSAILAEIEHHGHRSIKNLADPGKRTGPWWGMPRGKLALEWLYVTGRLSIHHRDHQFTTHYDLPHRVVPGPVIDQPTPTRAEAQAELLMLGAKSHGVGTAHDLADYFRIKMPQARPLLAELVEAGRLEQVSVEGWSTPAYLHPEARRPRSIDAGTVLSPFDPVVWFRDRAERLWDFRYRIEIYVPEPKREYGYYVLPFLLGDDLVGRVDLKADRAAGVLRVKGAYLEPDADPDDVADAMAANLIELATWLGLDSVDVERGDFAPRLRAALR